MTMQRAVSIFIEQIVVRAEDSSMRKAATLRIELTHIEMVDQM